MALFTTTAGFRWDKSDEGHELARVVETTEISQFADEGHGGDFLKAFEGHDGLNDGFPFPGFEDLFHFGDKPFDTIFTALDSLDGFLENDSLGVGWHGEFPQVAHVGGGPFGFPGVVETVAQEEGVEALLGAGEVVCGIGAGAADITHGFVQYWWNADLGDVSVTKQAGDVTGVAFVGFDFIAGLALGFGRGHEDAIDSFFDELACEDKAGGTCFVADFEIPEFDFEFFRELLEGFYRSGDAAGALAVVGGIIATPSKGVGDGNCFLVDVDSDVVDWLYGVFDYSIDVG